MKLITAQLWLFALACLVIQVTKATQDDKTYVNEWAVRVAGGERVARELAQDHGFEFVRKVIRKPTYMFGC